ncbi:MAG: nicotinamidase [Pirellulales bacterium]
MNGRATSRESTANPPELRPGDALILVDVQNDFCPGGALPVNEGDEIVPVLNRWIEAAKKARAKIVASRDWHPPDHVSFRPRGGPWPVHCVQNTPGAELHPDLKLPARTSVVSKGTDPDRDSYSAFDGTRLGRNLKRRGVHRVWVGGLALDVCVRATVLDALKAGFEVHLIKAGTRAVNVGESDGQRALREMQTAGCLIEEGGDDGPDAARQPAPVSTVHGSLRADYGPGVRRRTPGSAGGVRAVLPPDAAGAKLPRRRRPR